MEQEIRYCTSSDGVRIGYGTYGNDGVPPLVHMCEAPWQEAIWASPWGRECFEALARSHRFITFDSRGTGASQRDIKTQTLEGTVQDLLAVVDHLGISQFALLATNSFHAAGLTFAARYVERVTSLVLWSPCVAQRGRRDIGDSARANWGMYTRAAATLCFPSGPSEAQRWYSTSFRSGTTPDVVAQVFEWTYDLAALLPRLTMPALVLQRKHAQIVKTQQAREVASLIPNARLVTLDGDVGLLYWDHEQFIRLLEEFLGVAPSRPDTLPHGMTAILFADIVDSTALTERLGDSAFRDKARDLDTALRTIIRVSAGTPIEGKLLGDGVLAVFTSARQAIEAALACGKAGDDGGLPLHLGLHAGDVLREKDPDGRSNVYGGAVNIASRISGLSAPGEVLVSETVRSLARTSAGVAFEDRGEQSLKGVGEAVRVWAVVQDDR